MRNLLGAILVFSVLICGTASSAPVEIKLGVGQDYLVDAGVPTRVFCDGAFDALPGCYIAGNYQGFRVYIGAAPAALFQQYKDAKAEAIDLVKKGLCSSDKRTVPICTVVQNYNGYQIYMGATATVLLQQYVDAKNELVSLKAEGLCR